MELILVKDVEKLGFADDVVKVRPGFALNYLIPRGLAVMNSNAAEAQRNGRIKSREKKEARMVEQLNEISTRLQSAPVRIGAKVGTTGKIFGSVSAYHIAEAIKNQHQVE